MSGQRARVSQDGPVWFVTFTTYSRRPVFANPELVDVCADALRESAERNGYRVYAVAIVADHVHLVLDAGESGHVVAKVLNNVKGVTSRRVFQACPELKLDLGGPHLWTTRYHARVLLEAGGVEQACDYVEQNPVRLGFARQRYAWVRRVQTLP